MRWVIVLISIVSLLSAGRGVNSGGTSTGKLWAQLDWLEEENEELKEENARLKQETHETSELHAKIRELEGQVAKLKEATTAYHDELEALTARGDSDIEELHELKDVVVQALHEIHQLGSSIFCTPAKIRHMGILHRGDWYDAYMRAIDKSDLSQAYSRQLSLEENAEVALTMMTERLKDPQWHPFRPVLVHGKPGQQINEDDPLLLWVRSVWGDQICALVMRALIELEEFSPIQRTGVDVPWDYEAGRVVPSADVIRQIMHVIRAADEQMAECLRAHPPHVGGHSCLDEGRPGREIESFEEDIRDEIFELDIEDKGGLSDDDIRDEVFEHDGGCAEEDITEEHVHVSGVRSDVCSAELEKESNITESWDQPTLAIVEEEAVTVVSGKVTLPLDTAQQECEMLGFDPSIGPNIEISRRGHKGVQEETIEDDSL